MRKTTDRFPWHRTRPGESFFVPCVDIEATRLLGRRVAAKQGVPARDTPCIYQGVLGVMFKRS